MAGPFGFPIFLQAICTVCASGEHLHALPPSHPKYSIAMDVSAQQGRLAHIPCGKDAIQDGLTVRPNTARPTSKRLKKVKAKLITA